MLYTIYKLLYTKLGVDMFDNNDNQQDQGMGGSANDQPQAFSGNNLDDNSGAQHNGGHPFGAPVLPAVDDYAATTDNSAPEPEQPVAPSEPVEPVAAPEDSTPLSAVSSNSAPSSDELASMKQEALSQLQPLVTHLDLSPEEEFKTTMMMIQANDDQTLLKKAFEAAKKITDDKVRAQALLDVINEINYFSHHSE